MIAQERRRNALSSINSAQTKAEKTAEEYAGIDNARPEEVAEYLADMLESARGLAGKSGLTFLAYLIQVAVEEAKIQAAASQDQR